MELELQIQDRRCELVREHMNLVVHRAKRQHRMGAFLDMDDLIQQGCVGLLRAIEKFDPERRSRGRSVAFSTYATYWVDHAIRRAIQNHGRTIAIPVSVQRDCYAVSRSLLLTDYLSERRQKALHCASFEVIPFEEEMEPGQSKSCLDEPERRIHEHESASQVRALIERLTEKERVVVEHLYGLSEEAAPKSTDEVAKLLGISQTRVRQLRKRAIDKLRDEMKL